MIVKPVFLWGCDTQMITYTLSCNHSFHKVSLWGEVILCRCALRDIVMTQYGHYVNLPLKSGSRPGALR